MDKDKDIEKLFEAAQKIEMPEIPKRHIKMSILQHDPTKSIKSPFMLKFRFVIVPALIALLFVGGGVSYAAENTIPGDVLYPVKTGVNEKVAGFFAFSKPAKADWQGKLALRRLAEVERIAQRRGVDVSEVLETHFAKQAERFADRLDSLRESGETENLERLERKFAIAIERHEKVIERVENTMEKPERTRKALNRLALVRNTDTKNPAASVSAAPVAENAPVMMATLIPDNDSSQTGFLKEFAVGLDIEEQYSQGDVLNLTASLTNNTDEERILVFNNGCQEFEVLVNDYGRVTKPDMFCTMAIVEIPIQSGETYNHKMTVDLKNYKTQIGMNTLTFILPWGVPEIFSFEIVE